MAPESFSLKVSGLQKRLGRSAALSGLTLDFKAEKMHGLIGPEGAGKTTFLRCLTGLLRPSSGSIDFLVNGQEVPFSQIRPDIAYMPQQQSLYGDLSIAEHLEFFRDLYQVPEEIYQKRREELLGITRLSGFVDRPAGKLSGGMYKKLGLMCALLRSPRILLLDEPTNGVDPISRREFWELLYSLHNQNILIIVSTAYMDEAERCSEVHLMDQGKLIAEGEPQTLLRNYQVNSIDELFRKETEVRKIGK